MQCAEIVGEINKKGCSTEQPFFFVHLFVCYLMGAEDVSRQGVKTQRRGTTEYTEHTEKGPYLFGAPFPCVPCRPWLKVYYLDSSWKSKVFLPDTTSTFSSLFVL